MWPRIGIVTNFGATAPIRVMLDAAVTKLRRMGCTLREAKAPFDNPGFDIRNIDDDRRTIAERVFREVDVLSRANCRGCRCRIGVFSRMPPPQSKIHIAFEIGVILKGINGLLELIGGLLLLGMPSGAIQQFVARLTQNELSEDPRDFIATHLRDAASHLTSNAQLFAAIYLLAHGVIKALLVYGLLRDRLWAFPTAIAVFGAFGVYQMYRYAIAPSGWLIVLTVLDVAVILLTRAEWRRVKKRPSWP